MEGLVLTGSSTLPPSQMKKTIIPKADWHLVPADAEPGFNYERNQKIIDGTIKKYKAMQDKKVKIFKEGLAERNDAIISWVKSLQGSNKPIDQYLGREWMARLAGEKILKKINKLREIREKTNKWIV